MGLELGPEHARQRGVDPHDLLELVEGDDALAPGALLHPARKRETVQETGRADPRLRGDPHAPRRDAHRGAQGARQPLEPPAQRPCELAAVGTLDPVGHIGRGHAAKEVHLDRHRSSVLGRQEQRADQRGLAEASRTLEPAVASVKRPVAQPLKLSRTIDEGFARDRLLVDEGACHQC